MWTVQTCWKQLLNWSGEDQISLNVESLQKLTTVVNLLMDKRIQDENKILDLMEQTPEDSSKPQIVQRQYQQCLWNTCTIKVAQ